MANIQTLDGGQIIRFETSSPEEKGGEDDTVLKVKSLIGDLRITPSEKRTFGEVFPNPKGYDLFEPLPGGKKRFKVSTPKKL